VAQAIECLVQAVHLIAADLLECGLINAE
jgi:hypothetical protein